MNERTHSRTCRFQRSVRGDQGGIGRMNDGDIIYLHVAKFIPSGTFRTQRDKKIRSPKLAASSLRCIRLG